MDKRTKRNLAEQIKRRLTRELLSLGFTRTKPTFWTRPREHRVEFIHLHLFTFAPAFRVHLGIRVTNDTFEAVALNGLHSPDGWYGTGRKYLFEFAEIETSLERCASDLFRFCVDIADPWFRQFKDARVLLQRDSPLGREEKFRLQLALNGKAEPRCIHASHLLLGIVEPDAGPSGLNRTVMR